MLTFGPVRNSGHYGFRRPPIVSGPHWAFDGAWVMVNEPRTSIGLEPMPTVNWNLNVFAAGAGSGPVAVGGGDGPSGAGVPGV